MAEGQQAVCIAFREAAAQITGRMLHLWLLVPLVKRHCLWLYLEFVFAHVSIRRESDLSEGFPRSFEADWPKPSRAFAVLGGLVKKPNL